MAHKELSLGKEKNEEENFWGIYPRQKKGRQGGEKEKDRKGPGREKVVRQTKIGGGRKLTPPFDIRGGELNSKEEREGGSGSNGNFRGLLKRKESIKGGGGKSNYPYFCNIIR